MPGKRRAQTVVLAVIVALVLALAAGFALYRAQRWLAHRTHRIFNYGLVGASIALVVSVVWLVATFVVARSDLDTGLGQGAGRAIPGRGAARRPAWNAANEQVYKLGASAQYRAERDMVIGTGPGSSAAGYKPAGERHLPGARRQPADLPVRCQLGCERVRPARRRRDRGVAAGCGEFRRGPQPPHRRVPLSRVSLPGVTLEDGDPVRLATGDGDHGPRAQVDAVAVPQRHRLAWCDVLAVDQDTVR